MQTQSEVYDDMTAEQLINIVDTFKWTNNDAVFLIHALASRLEDAIEAAPTKEPLGGYEHNT